jgi:hypothetical protein
LLVCVFLFGCSSFTTTAETRHELDGAINQLCHWTGLRRLGPVTSVERWRTNDPGYNVRLQLAVDGSPRPYVVRFDSRRRLLSFEPESFDLSGVSQGLGYDTVKDRHARACSIAAVNHLNEHLRWTWYGQPAIQRVGPDFLVTYETVSAAEQRRSHYMYIDPYVSFVVTPKGTVFATFFGS